MRVISRESAKSNLTDPVLLAVRLDALLHRLPVVFPARAAQLDGQNPAFASVPT